MNPKYIVTQHHLMGEHMIIFHAGNSHNTMVPENIKAISAGEIKIDAYGKVDCYMQSTSLKIKRNEEREKKDDFLARSTLGRL